MKKLFTLIISLTLTCHAQVEQSMSEEQLKFELETQAYLLKEQLELDIVIESMNKNHTDNLPQLRWFHYGLSYNDESSMATTMSIVIPNVLMLFSIGHERGTESYFNAYKFGSPTSLVSALGTFVLIHQSPSIRTAVSSKEEKLIINAVQEKLKTLSEFYSHNISIILELTSLQEQKLSTYIFEEMLSDYYKMMPWSEQNTSKIDIFSFLKKNKMALEKIKKLEQIEKAQELYRKQLEQKKLIAEKQSELSEMNLEEIKDLYTQISKTIEIIEIYEQQATDPRKLKEIKERIIELRENYELNREVN